MEFGLDAVFVANSLHVRPGGEGFDDAHPPRCSRDAKPLARRCRRSPGSSKTGVRSLLLQRNKPFAIFAIAK
jgi:hypothetical protein